MFIQWTTSDQLRTIDLQFANWSASLNDPTHKSISPIVAHETKALNHFSNTSFRFELIKIVSSRNGESHDSDRRPNRDLRICTVKKKRSNFCETHRNPTWLRFVYIFCEISSKKNHSHQSLINSNEHWIVSGWICTLLQIHAMAANH